MAKLNYRLYNPSPQRRKDVNLHAMPHYFAARDHSPFEPHTHNDYMLVWFMEDGGWHEVDFVRYPVSANTMFVISPGQIHCFDESNTPRGIIIHFSEAFMAGETTEECVFIKYNVFNAVDKAPYYHLSTDLSARLQNLVDIIARELSKEEAFAHEEVVSMLIRYILIEIQRDGVRGNEAEPMKITCKSNQTFVRFRQILEHHYHELHTVRDYASMLGMTQKMLTRRVWTSAHATPLQIINQRIIIEAKRLLAYSDMTVKEVAYRLGFEDSSYFVKFFKRLAEVSPNAFRKNVM